VGNLLVLQLFWLITLLLAAAVAAVVYTERVAAARVVSVQEQVFL
jgi:hypothetical protein